ncbi:MAG TPA: Jag N-terminal domain-containing protein [Candidatus Babeliales bacterium]|nr:Jag N-terminal domain-containing protein [Candidatus Babeliales bacterium]
MKSMLKEASSLGKAVEQAWKEVGMPEEFTIKVFEKGERGFLGFVKKAALISILFDLKGDAKVARAHKGGVSKSTPKQVTRVDTSQKREDRGVEATTPVQQKTFDPQGWETSYLVDMGRWVKDMISMLDAGDRTFKIFVSSNVLNIEFDKPILRDFEQERILFSSFAYFLMQFLKRKYKNKFRGLRISISSARR